jgi:glutamate synthase (NADPH/NADH) small chain
MGDKRGFLKYNRITASYRPVCERVQDFKDVAVPRSDDLSRQQASRCMDCGTPFCHFACPVGNYIPEWNDLTFNDQWQRAFYLLDTGNNLPEVTGRICPAPCEYACVLGINDDPVTIRENELSIIEYAFKNGLIKPNPPKIRTGKKVAVVGSGPAGLACAAQLNKLGHTVTVFERDDKLGGLMRYGIPDFKLEKYILDRRIDLWQKEGVIFKTGVNVGVDLSAEKLKHNFDAVCLTGGSRVPRDLKIEGRDLGGIHFAMDYLVQSNKRVIGSRVKGQEEIDAKGKKVVIIGGGDTGSDCVGTANRQGADCVVQIEVLPEPPACRNNSCPWPRYPLLLKTTSSHEEDPSTGSGQVPERKWCILTKKFTGENGRVKQLHCIQVDPNIKEIPGLDFIIEADLVIICIGFLHPEHKGLIHNLGVALDSRGNVKTDENYMTSIKGIFAAGDMHRGQSLIVWAIAEGREAAEKINRFLMPE